MKNFKYKFLGLLLIFVLGSCNYDNIDPLTKVEAGSDAGSPEIIINYPQEGTVISEPEELSNVTVDLKVQDDIELQKIVVLVDDQEVATFTEFTDYRIALEQVVYEGLSMGNHSVTVRATDMEGNETVKTVNFSKEPPYTPKFENEIFYMPFDKTFMELIGFQTADKIGDPAFSDDAYEGTGAYKGAKNSYLSIPLPELEDEFTIAFWYKLDASVDRAGILTATDDDDLNQGFRLFRESAGEGQQKIKLNLGTGGDSVWNDGGDFAANGADWMHITLTVSPTGTAIYFNGVLIRSTELNNFTIDWTGVKNLVIGSGLNFNGWGHNSDTSLIDELRIFDKALSKEEIEAMVNPSTEELTFYLPFEGDFIEQATGRTITTVGSPGFSEDAKVGMKAYAGAQNSYLTFSSDGLLSDEFTTTFWYKVNSTPDRAGIITVSAANEDPSKNNLTKGFQLFREGSADSQRIKASVGTGDGNSWNDGGLIDATVGEWVFIAFTISETKSKIYINGELATEASLNGGVDWTGADLVSVMSGAPRFIEWNHLSDKSYMDDLKFYNKVLTQEEIQAAMNASE